MKIDFAGTMLQFLTVTSKLSRPFTLECKPKIPWISILGKVYLQLKKTYKTCEKRPKRHMSIIKKN